MSKTKTTSRSRYEILFIVPNKFTETEAKKIIDDTEKLIADNGGEVTYREYWGKKKMAYEIKHQWYGYYQLFIFDCDGDKLQKMDLNLKLSTDILRHQIVKAVFKTEEEMTKQKERQDKLNAAIAPKKPMGKTDEEKPAKEAVEQKEIIEEEKPAEKDSKKADLKDLDDKLDGILESSEIKI